MTEQTDDSEYALNGYRLEHVCFSFESLKQISNLQSDQALRKVTSLHLLQGPALYNRVGEKPLVVSQVQEQAGSECGVPSGEGGGSLSLLHVKCLLL